MNRKIGLNIILIIFLLPGFAAAQYERPGSSGGQFLGIGVSARATAMGEAFISVTNGAEATYYNPAATVQIKRTDIVVTHTKWFANINHTFAAVVHNFDRWGTLGALFTGVLTDEMEVRTPLQPDGTGETFYAGNYRFGISYARSMTDMVSFGGSLNYIYSSLYDNFSANAVSVDIAVLFITGYRDFNFGLKFEHFGSQLKFINEAYPLPTNFQFGISINALDNDTNKLLVALSAKKHNEGKPIGQIGTEWNVSQRLFVRGGYQINSDVATYSFGAGLKWQVMNYQIRFDYSYNDFSLLGVAHRFEIGFSL